MLRLLVLALLVANGVYAGWTSGWLSQWAQGLPAPEPTREPHRARQQVEPERIVLLTESAESVGAQTGTPTESLASGLTNAQGAHAIPHDAAHSADNPESGRCVQVTSLNDKQLAVLRIALLATQPEGSWNVKQTTQPARWIVYSGKLPSPAAMSAKRAELRLLGLEFREVQTPALQPGLALGTYSSESGAQQALRDATRVGVKGARVVQERADITSATVQWPNATEAQTAQTEGLLQRLSSEGLEGKQLQPCN